MKKNIYLCLCVITMAKRTDDDSELRGLDLVVAVTVIEGKCLSNLFALLGSELFDV